MLFRLIMLVAGFGVMRYLDAPGWACVLGAWVALGLFTGGRRE